MKTHMFRNVLLGTAVMATSLFGSSQIARADHYHHRHNCGPGYNSGVHVNSGYGYGYSLRPPVYGYNGYYGGFATPQFVNPNWVGYGAGGYPINGSYGGGSFPINGSYGGGSFPTYGSYGGTGFSLYIGR